MKAAWILLCCAITVAAYSVGADDGSVAFGIVFALIVLAVLCLISATFRWLVNPQGPRRV